MRREIEGGTVFQWMTMSARSDYNTTAIAIAIAIAIALALAVAVAIIAKKQLFKF